jgi:hypothetical protein
VQKITELTYPPIIGEFYLVPCLFSQIEKGRSIPVIADFHEDAEIGFFDEHIHPDFRFFNNYEFRMVINRVIRDGESLHSLVYPFRPHRFITWEKRQCFREVPEIPTEVLNTDLMELLEQIYRDSKLSCGICPHKGANLNSIAPDANGNKVCPLHNLMWAADGYLVPRFGH